MNWCLKGIFLTFIILFISGCSQKQDDNKLEILFFAKLPTTLEEPLKTIIGEHFENVEEYDLQIELYPMSMEKLFIELTARNGDIYFIDQSYIHGIIDPIGLYPLDELVEELTLNGLVQSEFKDIHPDTNEEHIYAVPINGKSLMMRELGIELENSEELGAIISSYSNKIEDAIEILKQLAAQ